MPKTSRPKLCATARRPKITDTVNVRSGFQRTGWGLLDRATNVYVTLDLVFNLVVLAALSFHGYVVWTGVGERRRQAQRRARR